MNIYFSDLAVVTLEIEIKRTCGTDEDIDFILL